MICQICLVKGEHIYVLLWTRLNNTHLLSFVQFSRKGFANTFYL